MMNPLCVRANSKGEKMPVPTRQDLIKQKRKIESLQKSIRGEGEGNSSRLSEKQMCGIVRSAIRKAWSRSPVRLLKLEMAKEPDKRVHTRTKWLVKCSHCGQKFQLKDIEVDHIKGEHKLTTLADIHGFADSILNVTLDDLQLLDKKCHRIKTYGERHGMSFDEAELELKTIDHMKKQNTKAQKLALHQYGFTPEEYSNPEKRKDLFRELIRCGRIK